MKRKTVLGLRSGEKGKVREILPWGGGWGPGFGGGWGFGWRRGWRFGWRGGRGWRCGWGPGWRWRGWGWGPGRPAVFDEAYEEVYSEVLGVRPGEVVEVVENRGWGPVVLKVGNRKFVLGRNQAAHILVEQIEEPKEEVEAQNP